MQDGEFEVVHEIWEMENEKWEDKVPVEGETTTLLWIPQAISNLKREVSRDIDSSLCVIWAHLSTKKVKRHLRGL